MTFSLKRSFKDTMINNNEDPEKKITKFKKVDTIPYYVNQLYGPGCKVLYHLNDVNNDLLNLTMGINQSINKRLPYQMIKQKIMDEFRESKDDDLINKYNKVLTETDKVLNRETTKKYESYREIYNEIDNNIVHIPDLQLILNSLDVNNENNIDKTGLLTDLAIILISYDKNKKTKLYFYSTKELYILIQR